jgi:hypothetical protein
VGEGLGAGQRRKEAGGGLLAQDVAVPGDGDPGQYEGRDDAEEEPGAAIERPARQEPDHGSGEEGKEH